MNNTMATYQNVLGLAKQLAPVEQLQLLESLAIWVRQELNPAPGKNILELQGLGKEIWKGMDAQEYVNQERASSGG
jgi:hypothetical protein